MELKDKMHSHKYLPYVDGLRAIAVLSVLIYHINPLWLPGGFVGVDIFFVISGYLITGIIYQEIVEGQFSIFNFYNRRIKRILPVYYLVSLATGLAAYILFLPDDFVDFGKSLLSSSLFVSNYYFWQSTDYFSKSVELKPLVHTWSLAVEEQFYIFWPLFLLVMMSTFRHLRLLPITIVLIILGAGSSYILTQYDSSFAYYSLFTRAHELMIGACLCFFKLHSEKIKSLVFYVGFAFILWSLFNIDKSSDFPGLISFIPSIGAGLIIMSGGVKSVAINMLSNRVLVFIGLISYSLYMWHWPVLSVVRYYFVEPSITHLLLAAVLIFLLSYGTRVLLEKPLIKRRMEFRSSLLFLFVIPTFLFISFGAWIIKSDGMESRYSFDQIKLLEQQHKVRLNCKYTPTLAKQQDNCRINSKSLSEGHLKILVWGDSHAANFYDFFQKFSQKASIEVTWVAFPGCPPINGVYRINRTYSDECYLHNKKVLNDILETRGYDLLVLTANWVNYGRGSNLADDIDKSVTTANSKRALYSGLLAQLNELSQVKELSTWVFNSVPNFNKNVGDCEIKRNLWQNHPEDYCQMDLAFIKADRVEFDQSILELTSQRSNLEYFDFTEAFCDSKKCAAYKDGKLFYIDYNHLTSVGSEQVFQFFLNKYADKLEIFKNNR